MLSTSSISVATSSPIVTSKSSIMITSHTQRVFTVYGRALYLCVCCTQRVFTVYGRALYLCVWCTQRVFTAYRRALYFRYLLHATRVLLFFVFSITRVCCLLSFPYNSLRFSKWISQHSFASNRAYKALILSNYVYLYFKLDKYRHYPSHIAKITCLVVVCWRIVSNQHN